MTRPRIFVVCPDYNEPSGGIRKLYLHVDVLARHGISAFVLHQRPGFRCSWFASATPVAYQGQVTVTPDDFMLVPEIYGPDLAAAFPGVPKVVFNQNSYLTYHGYSLDRHDLRTPYTHPDVLATLVVSEDNRAYLAHAFPAHRFVRVHYGIDTGLFACLPDKKPVIAYMPRKNAGEALQVFNILKFRGLLGQLEPVAIQGQAEAQVAAFLGTTLFFFSFGYPEGCPLPPLEAMACGCVVVGYHGWGGREYLREQFSYPVEPADVLGLARQAEAAILQWQQDPTAVRKKGDQAAAFVRQHYSREQEEEDIISFWRTTLGSRWAPVA